MTESEPQFITVGSGDSARRIATLAAPAAQPGAPGLMWLIGLKSDMVSTKAEALAEWTAARGLGFTRFDYSGHGRSGGVFEDATISDWLDESEAVFRQLTRGPQVLVGSSTGAHLALLLLRRLMRAHPEEAKRVIGLVLVAPAWDLTELMWDQLPEDARDCIMTEGKWMRPSPYDPVGYPITKRFIEDGKQHLFKGTHFDPRRPVLVLQGAEDRDVPIAHARGLATVLAGDHVRIAEVADGEHRLSRPQDLDKLYALVDEVLAVSKAERASSGWRG
jgi:pimeloyl-ACP methyl ester carboxylesterase